MSRKGKETRVDGNSRSKQLAGTNQNDCESACEGGKREYRGKKSRNELGKVCGKGHDFIKRYMLNSKTTSGVKPRLGGEGWRRENVTKGGLEHKVSRVGRVGERNRDWSVGSAVMKTSRNRRTSPLKRSLGRNAGNQADHKSAYN